MRGEYCEFTFADGSRCVFGGNHKVNYHHSETGLDHYPAEEGDSRKGDWIQLVSGEPFWPLDPRRGEIQFDDIACALSMLCRYGGHCTRYYSVAEHSVLVSRLVPAEHALWGLLHDATEAYLVDLPRPVKYCLPEYRRAEDRLAGCIAERFGLPWPAPQEVKLADAAALQIERSQLMAESRLPWASPSAEVLRLVTEAGTRRLPCWSPVEARAAFRSRWAELVRLDSLEPADRAAEQAARERARQVIASLEAGDD